MRCAVCKAYIPEGALHCMECGTLISGERICQKCGASMDTFGNFCRKCGTPMKPAPEARLPVESEPTGTGTASKERTCILCGSKVQQGIQYCPTCGTNQDVLEGKVDLQKGPVIQMETDPSAKRDGSSPCPSCGAEVRGSGRFCYACGRYLGTDIEEIICPKCGAVASLRYSRCQFCGAEIIDPTKM